MKKGQKLTESLLKISKELREKYETPSYRVGDRIKFREIKDDPDYDDYPYQEGEVIGVEEESGVYTVSIDKKYRLPSDTDGLAEVPFDHPYILK